MIPMPISPSDYAEARFREFADAMPHILWTALPDGRLDYLNKVYTDYTGIELDFASQNWILALHPDDVDRTRATWSHAIASGNVYVIEFRIMHKPSRQYRWQAVTAKPIKDEREEIVKWYGISTDIHDTKEASEKAALLGQRLNSTLESMTDGFLMLDRDWRVLYINSAAENCLQRSRSSLLGKVLWDEYGEMVGSKVYEACLRVAAAREHTDVEFEYSSSESHRWYEIRMYPSEDGMSMYWRDVTSRKNAEEEIQRLAFLDQLTGLPNRQLLHDRLQHAISMSSLSQRQGALMFIDLDNFKELNDMHGHGHGDLLLQQVAKRLASCMRESDTVARFGGDEFIVVLEELSEDPIEAAMQAKVFAEKILNALRQPYDVAGIQHTVTPSIGVAMFNEKPSRMDELLKWADLAMYRAKASGRDTICFYDRNMEAAVREKIALESDVRESVRDSLFTLQYQPQFDQNGRTIGAEALVRWRHPVRGNVPPSVFIPVAEETGLILPLGKWILRTACTQLKEWEKELHTVPLTLSVNVSAKQFRHPTFVEDIISIVGEANIDPKKLKLELTESILVEDADEAVIKMEKLKEYGIDFSMDDFGTGYSSLAYLSRMPLTQLKIDKSFINDVPHNENDVSIVEAIIALARKLSLSVIAEGVETQQQLDFLAANGCNAYQGYFFSKPLDAQQFISYITGMPLRG